MTAGRDISRVHGRRADIVSGALVVLLGAAVVLHVRGFPELPGGQPGPALFPGIVGALLVMFGLVLTVRAIVGRGHPPDADPAGGPASTPRARWNALAVLGLIASYILLAETLGFALTMAPLLFLLMWLLGTRPWIAAAAAAVTTALILLLFQQLLLVPLPTGLFG